MKKTTFSKQPGCRSPRGRRFGQRGRVQSERRSQRRAWSQPAMSPGHCRGQLRGARARARRTLGVGRHDNVGASIPVPWFVLFLWLGFAALGPWAEVFVVASRAAASARESCDWLRGRHRPSGLRKAWRAWLRGGTYGWRRRRRHRLRPLLPGVARFSLRQYLRMSLVSTLIVYGRADAPHHRASTAHPSMRDRRIYSGDQRAHPPPAETEAQREADEERITREGSVGGRAGYNPSPRVHPQREHRAAFIYNAPRSSPARKSRSTEAIFHDGGTSMMEVAARLSGDAPAGVLAERSYEAVIVQQPLAATSPTTSVRSSAGSTASMSASTRAELLDVKTNAVRPTVAPSAPSASPSVSHVGDVVERAVPVDTAAPGAAHSIPASIAASLPGPASYFDTICAADGNVFERMEDTTDKVPRPRYACTLCRTGPMIEINMEQHRDHNKHKDMLKVSRAQGAVPYAECPGGPPRHGAPQRTLAQADAAAVRLTSHIPLDKLRDMFSPWAAGTTYTMKWSHRCSDDVNVYVSRGTIHKNERVAYDGMDTTHQLPHFRTDMLEVWSVVPERIVFKQADRCPRSTAETARDVLAVSDSTEDDDEKQIPVGTCDPHVLIYATRELIAGYSKASPRERTAMWLRVLSLPKNILRVKGGYKGNKDDGRVPGDGGSVDEHDRAIKKALKRAREGFIGRAARILDTIVRKITLPVDVVAAKLRALHPDAVGPSPAPPLRDGSTIVGSLPVEELEKIVKALTTGASNGPTAWSAEMVFVIMGDDVCKKEFAAMMLDLVNGEIDDCVRKRLVRARLVPLGKPDGGIRPIAIGETFLKIAGKVLFARYGEEINEHFGKLQFGCLHKKGVERVVHNVRADIAEGRHVLAVDQANAFNSPFRYRIAMALYAVPVFRYFWRIFFLEYGATSDLLFFDGGKLYERIPSQRGTRQGSTLGGFFFCVVLHPVLKELADKFPEIRIYAYMDDVTMTGKDPEELARAFFLFRDLCRPLGLEFNAKKCDWLGAGGVAIPESLATEGVVQCDGCVKILGAYIGEAGAVRQKLLDKLTKHDLLFERLIRMGAGSAQYGILLKCALPRHGHNLRVHHPDVVLDSARAFDRRVLDVAVAWFHTPDDEDLRLARLPQRFDGSGMVETVDISEHAYNDSVWDALDVLGKHPVPSPQKPPSQRNACSRMYEARRAELYRTGGPTVQRLLDLNALAGAKRWLTSATTWMPGHCFAHSFRLKANVASTRLPSYATCPACPQLGPMTQKDFAIHAHGCTKIPSADNATGAHNWLRDTIVKTGRANALACGPEPKGYQKYTCSTCGTVIDGINVTRRVYVHDRTCSSKLYRSGVDVEGWVIPQCNINHENKHKMERVRFLLDVTIAHLICHSYLDTTIASAVTAKVSEKTARYVTSGMIPAEVFRVGVMFSTGGCDAGMMAFLAQFAVTAGLVYEELIADVTNTVMWAQGASIDAAFRMAEARSCAIET